jgi:hypothetical protein
MNIEQLVCVSIGFIVQATTFAVGILVGASLRRKEPDHGASGSRAEAAKCCR